MTSKFGFQFAVNDRMIWVFPEDVEAAANAAKAAAEVAKAKADKAINDLSASVKSQAAAGIAYSWTRASGEDPISLGNLASVGEFVNNMIGKIGKAAPTLGEAINPAAEIKSLVDGLPLPEKLENVFESIQNNAYFELDSLRLRIPGKGSGEKWQFELGMIVNLSDLGLELGPFQFTRLYARIGNFK